MSKTTPEEAIAWAKKHDLRLNGYGCHEKLAALIDELRGVDAEPVAYQYQDREGLWYPFVNDAHYKNTLKDGSWPIRALYTHPAPSQPAAPVELPVVAQVQTILQGQNRGRQVVMLVNLANGEKLVKLSDAQAAIAAGRKAS